MFDSNGRNNFTRLDNQLDWLVADMNASDALWKVVFVHHPIAGSPDKTESPEDNYYQQVVSRLNDADVDLFLAGHSHLYHRTFPLLGQSGGTALFVPDMDNDYAKGAGLIQVVAGVGGQSLRPGDFSPFPFDVVGFSTTTVPAVEYGFAQVDATSSLLTVSYVAADDGAVLDSFTICVPEPSTLSFAFLCVMALFRHGGRESVGQKCQRRFRSTPIHADVKEQCKGRPLRSATADLESMPLRVVAVAV